MSELVVQPPPEPALVHRFMDQRSSEVEEAVRSAFERWLAPQYPQGMAVVAVGGFGRRELFPFSDTDIMLLVEKDSDLPPKGVLGPFLQDLWDARLRPSHSVHSLADCVTEQDGNTEFTISLLDHRLLTGDAALYQQLRERFVPFCSRRGPSVARRLIQLVEERRVKGQNTIYHLEPNVKELPGGLRDLHTVRWLNQLEPHGAVPDLRAAFDLLAGIRWRLHEAGSRDQNVLSFEAQEAMSEHPDALMRDYYRQARHVDRCVRMAMAACIDKPGSLLGRFHDWRSRLSTADYTVVRDRVLLRGHKPPTDLSLFIFVARHGLQLAPDTIERLQGFVPNVSWQDWKKLLNLPKPSAGLRAMQESGVLTAALPEWQNIECLVVRDFYHRYTVDEHTLVAIDTLEHMTDGRFADLLAGVEDPALIRMALLLHDIGKGSGRDHSEASLDIARAVLERLGAPEQEREIIEFLVLHHLDLSSVMSTRDLHDPATARTLAESVQTVERLKLLTMLTYADISAVNPQAMSPWRLEQLWLAYASTYEEFTRELATERIHDAAGMAADRARFLEGLPTRYLRTHTPREVDAHFELAEQLASRPLALEIQQDRGFYRLVLLTKDRPALFTSVAGAIASFGLNIVKAEAFSNAGGVVVDSFTFSDPHRTLELNPSEVDRLRGVVRKVVEGKQSVESLLKGRGKPFSSSRLRFRPRVAFKNEVTESATLVEIAAEDRPGLLYDLAHVFSQAGCNIELVMIDTEAHKALDVFYVTYQGRKLHDTLEAELKSELLAACIGPR